MSLDKCPICKEYTWGMNHNCKPAFHVFRGEDDLFDCVNQGWIPQIFRGSDEENAAVAYCESDYENPDELEVLVVGVKIYEESLEELTDDNTDVVVENILSKCKKFEMESEVVRNFYATEK